MIAVRLVRATAAKLWLCQNYSFAPEDSSMIALAREDSSSTEGVVRAAAAAAGKHKMSITGRGASGTLHMVLVAAAAAAAAAAEERENSNWNLDCSTLIDRLRILGFSS